MPGFSIDQELLKKGPILIGVDEAGYGPWAGPVVAGAIHIPQAFWQEFQDHKVFSQIKDSKKLSEKKRNLIYEELKSCALISCGIGIASVEEIDNLNVLRASHLAMERAVQQITPSPSMIILDGNKKPHWQWPCHTVIDGDNKSYSIAAASILAKVTRDTIMKELSCNYPAYKWDKNVGYGTKDHQNAIAEYGITPHHRRSFAPIAKYLEAA